MREASEAKPIEDVRDISAITYGFMASKGAVRGARFRPVSRISTARPEAGPARGADSVCKLVKGIGISENLLGAAARIGVRVGGVEKLHGNDAESGALGLGSRQGVNPRPDPSSPRKSGASWRPRASGGPDTCRTEQCCRRPRSMGSDVFSSSARNSGARRQSSGGN